MSFTAARASKQAHKRCESCRERKARFAYRGVVRADRDHTLCFECYRSERERRRAHRMVEVPSSSAPPRIDTHLTTRQLDHRRAMLAFASRVRDGAQRLIPF